MTSERKQRCCISALDRGVSLRWAKRIKRQGDALLFRPSFSTSRQFPLEAALINLPAPFNYKTVNFSFFFFIHSQIQFFFACVDENSSHRELKSASNFRSGDKIVIPLISRRTTEKIFNGSIFSSVVLANYRRML